MKRICRVGVLGLLISLCAAAQDDLAMQQARSAEDKAAMEQAQKAPATAMQTSTIMAKLIGSDREVLTAPVTGAPYSADEVTTFTQTLADGTHIQREDKVTVYRDSQGRLRRETPTEITITDPVAGVAYALDPNKLTARKQMVIMKRQAIQLPTPVTSSDPGPAMMAARRAAEEGMASAKMSQDQAAANKTYTMTTGSGHDIFIFLNGQTYSKTSVNSQFLGSQGIEGVLSEGTSTNETIPVGAIGNDRPIQVVNERWYSNELKTTVMTKHSDPRTGEEVFRLTNIRRIEPGLDLFQVPAGYQVVGTAKE